MRLRFPLTKWRKTKKKDGNCRPLCFRNFVFYALAVKLLKKTKLKPRNNIKWNGNSPKSFKGTALYMPKRKYNIKANSNIILGDSFLAKYLLPFQLWVRLFMLNLGVRTNSLRLPMWPSSTAMELCKEKPKATEKKVKNSFM